MDLSRFPRVRLCHCPTPLEPMNNLADALGGPRLFIKRDDCTGLAMGGNKTRNLEFLMADAIQHGADTVVTIGAVQSNHTRQTAAAANKLGLSCDIILERRVDWAAPEYEASGNAFLDRILGATIHYQAGSDDVDGSLRKVAAEVARAGGKPYVIPAAGANRIGALGYVNCALELVRQAADTGLRIDWVVLATGGAGTHAGLLTGLAAVESGIDIYGVCVRAAKAEQEEKVYKLASETAAFVGIEGGIPRARVIADGDYVGPGYGLPTPEMIEAVNLTARHEGIILDPVYTGKAMAGLIGLVRRGFFAKDANVVFLHTGGTAAMFAYQSVFAENPTAEPVAAAAR